MNIVQLRRFTALLALVVTISACGGGTPTSPTNNPPPSNDPPGPAPVANTARIESITTQAGAVITAGSTVYMPDTVTFRIRYTTPYTGDKFFVNVDLLQTNGFHNVPGRWLRDVQVEAGVIDKVYQVEKAPCSCSPETKALRVTTGIANSTSVFYEKEEPFLLYWEMRQQ